MTRIGVVSNPRSHRNRRGMAALRATLAAHPEALHEELADIGDLAGILREFGRREVDLIVVNGGDGTVQATLTELINNRPFQVPPALAVLPTGMTNLIALDVGLRGRPDRALAKLLASGGAARRVVRPVLSMSYDAERPPVHGMFFGTAAFYQGTMLGREKIHPLGIEQSAAAGLALGLFAARSLCRRGRGDPLFRGEAMAIRIDERYSAEGDYFMLIVTTLARLLLGIDPFWGEGAGPLRYTSIAFPPRRLGRALLPVLRGRPRPWMSDCGYDSGKAGRIQLTLRCPLVLDGEIFSAGPNGTVVLSGGHAVTFACG